MGKARKHTPEQIVNILRQIEVAVANGKVHPVASRDAGITEQTYHRGAGSTAAVSGRNLSLDRDVPRALPCFRHVVGKLNIEIMVHVQTERLFDAQSQQNEHDFPTNGELS